MSLCCTGPCTKPGVVWTPLQDQKRATAQPLTMPVVKAMVTKQQMEKRP